MGGQGSGPQPGYRRPKPDPRVIAADDGQDMTPAAKADVVRIISTGGTYESACKELLLPMEKLKRHMRRDDTFRLSVYDAWYASDHARTVEVEMALFDKIGTGDTRAMEKWLDNRSKDRWAPATKLPGPTLQVGTINILDASQTDASIKQLQAVLQKRRELTTGSIIDAEVIEDS